MKYSALSLAAFAALVSAQVDPSIQTPQGVTVCETSSLIFNGTHPPFIISAIQGGVAGSAPFETIVTTSVSPYPWLVNLPVGAYFTLQIRDSVGSLQYSSPVTVLTGSTGCLANSTNTAGTVVSTNVPSATGTSSTPGGSTTGGSTSGGSSPTSKPSGSGSSTSPSSTTTSKKSGAMHLEAKMGLAGILGLIGAALLI